MIALALFVSLCPFDGAAEMPQHAEDELQQILAQPEFQPRSHSSSLQERALTQLKELLGAALRWVGTHAPRIDRDTWFGSTLLSIAERIAALWIALRPYLRVLLSVLVGVLALFALVRIARWAIRRMRGVRVSHAGPEHGAEEPAARDVRLSELYAQGDWQALLLLLRAELRERIRRLRGLPLSLTDRQVVRALPGQLPLRAVFDQVARLFERRAFAQVRVSDEEIRSVFERYRSLQTSEER